MIATDWGAPHMIVCEQVDAPPLVSRAMACMRDLDGAIVPEAHHLVAMANSEFVTNAILTLLLQHASQQPAMTEASK